MNHLTPIELLEERLYMYERALQKSFLDYKKTGDETLYRTHKENLEPKIFQYKQAVNYLKQWLS